MQSEPTPNVLTIAIVDDDNAVREGMEIVLDHSGRAVFSYPDGNSFLAALPGVAPDIAFLDLRMPGLSGMDVLRALGTPAFPIVMISAHGDIATAVRALKLGATDFIEKPFTPETLEAVIDQCLAPMATPARADAELLLGKLTPRERDVALLLNEGLANKEVAQQLKCSPRTVEIHRARVFEKLDVRNVAGLVRKMATLPDVAALK